MTELDLGLKVAMRRLFWKMGFSTRVDVPLRAYVPKSKGSSRARPGTEEFTDLDVLGVGVAPDLRLQSVIADCKTSAKGSTERMFWIRGVADFFRADDAYMVRARDVTAASRQLAARLGVAVITPADLAALEEHYSDEVVMAPDGGDFMFDVDSIDRYRKDLKSVDRKLAPLREYQEFDFWVYEEHSGLLQVVAHLTDAAKVLSPANRVHQALFLESTWLDVLAIARAVHHVRRTHLTDIQTSLGEYLFGGQVGLREKQRLAGVLRSAAGRGNVDPNDGVFPPYFPALLELSTRFVRRPRLASTVLRYAEWAAEAHGAGHIRPASQVFLGYIDLAGKLLADVCGFLVAAAGLNPEFRNQARAVFAPNGEVDRRSVQTRSPTTSGKASPSRSAESQASLPLEGKTSS